MKPILVQLWCLLEKFQSSWWWEVAVQSLLSPWQSRQHFENHEAAILATARASIEKYEREYDERMTAASAAQDSEENTDQPGTIVYMHEAEALIQLLEGTPAPDEENFCAGLNELCFLAWIGGSNVQEKLVITELYGTCISKLRDSNRSTMETVAILQLLSTAHTFNRTVQNSALKSGLLPLVVSELETQHNATHQKVVPWLVHFLYVACLNHRGNQNLLLQREQATHRLSSNLRSFSQHFYWGGWVQNDALNLLSLLGWEAPPDIAHTNQSLSDLEESNVSTGEVSC